MQTLTTLPAFFLLFSGSLGRPAESLTQSPECRSLGCLVRKNYGETGKVGRSACFHTTRCEAYSFTTDGYGIFNMRTSLGVCRTYEGGSGTNKSAQEGWHRGTQKLFLIPARGSNWGSLVLNSDSLTSELYPRSRWQRNQTTDTHCHSRRHAQTCMHADAHRHRHTHAYTHKLSKNIKTTRGLTPYDHQLVVFLCGTDNGITPVDVHSLTTMQLQ